MSGVRALDRSPLIVDESGPSELIRMQIRKLRRDEMNAAAAVHRSAFHERLPWLTGLHTPEEGQTYFSKNVFIACQVLGAFNDDCLVGFIAFREGWIDHLYVHPQTQARGAGTTLLNCAKAVEPVLRLWTFQKSYGPPRLQG